MQELSAVETFQMQVSRALMLVHILIYEFARALRNSADEALLHELCRLTVQGAFSSASVGQVIAYFLYGKGSVGVFLQKSEQLASFFRIIAHINHHSVAIGDRTNYK